MARHVPLALAVSFALALPEAGAAFEIGWFTVDGGGAMGSSGGGFEVSGTIGQPDAGAMSGGGFTITGGFWAAPVPPNFASAVSRKTQGLAGTFDINVQAAAAVEDRVNGATTLVVTFTEAVHGAGGLDPTDVSVSNGSVTGATIVGNQLTATLSSVANVVPLTVAFPGILGAQEQPVARTLCFGNMVGDANGDRSTNIFDLVLIRNSLNTVPNGSTFRTDVNADGNIDIFDLVLTRNNLNLTVSACP